MPTAATKRTVTIPINEALSSVSRTVQGETCIGLIVPAAWTTAAITFQGSVDGVTFSDMFDSAGVEITIPSAAVSASRALLFTPEFLSAFLAFSNIKVRSGTSGAPVNQAAARTVTLIFREV